MHSDRSSRVTWAAEVAELLNAGIAGIAEPPIAPLDPRLPDGGNTIDGSPIAIRIRRRWRPTTCSRSPFARGYPEMGMTGEDGANQPLRPEEAAIIPPVSIREIRDCADRRGHDGDRRWNECGRRQSSGPARGPPPISHKAVLQQYCVGCHNGRTRPAALPWIASTSTTYRHTRRRGRRSCASCALAPCRRPACRDRTRPPTSRWHRRSKRRSTRRRPRDLSPERRRLHRLNRTEYANAIRDLLALEIDPASLLPPDDASGGFDNNAGLLGVSPTLLERYLSAAAKISALAVGDATLIGASSQTYLVRGDASQSEHVEGLPLGTRGGVLARHTFPLDGVSTSSRRSCSRPTWVPSAVSSSRTRSSYSIDGRACSRRRSAVTRDNAMSAANAADDHHGARCQADRARRRQGRAAHVAATFLKRTAAQGGSRLQPVLADHARCRGPHRAAACRQPHRHRSVQRDRPRRHAQPPPDLHCQPASLVGGAAVREDDPLHVGSRGLPSARLRTERSTACWLSIVTVGGRAASRRESSSGFAASLRTRSSCFALSPHSPRLRRASRPRRTSRAMGPHRRLRARVPAVVLSLEQHSGR